MQEIIYPGRPLKARRTASGARAVSVRGGRALALVRSAGALLPVETGRPAGESALALRAYRTIGDFADRPAPRIRAYA